MESFVPNPLEAQARRLYSYFIFRLRQPEEAERLTRLTLQRAHRAVDRREEEEYDADQRLFRAARGVLASHPRRGGARKAEPRSWEPDAAPGAAAQLSDGLAIGL